MSDLWVLTAEWRFALQSLLRVVVGPLGIDLGSLPTIPGGQNCGNGTAEDSY